MVLLSTAQVSRWARVARGFATWLRWAAVVVQAIALIRAYRKERLHS